MKPVWILAAALMITLSGCLAVPMGGEADGMETEFTTDASAQDEAPRVPPADIQVEELATPSMDPLSLAEGPCATPTADCRHYKFTIEDYPWQLTAKLEWLVPTNDFDLYLVSGGQIIADSSGFVPQTSETFSTQVASGEYALVVSGWAVAADQFTLTGTFS